MPTGDGEPVPNPNPNPSTSPSSSKGDRRPQLKKSRTISAEPSTSSSVSSSVYSDASSHGPPLLAVRRSCTAPLPPRRLTVAVDDPSDSQPAAAGGVLDRDWYYPSFLGPYPSRTRSAVRVTGSVARSAGKKRDSLLPASANRGAAASQSRPDGHAGSSSVSVERPAVTEEETGRAEELKPVVAGIPTSTASVRGTHWPVSSLISSLLSTTSIVCLLFAVSWQSKVLKLEEEVLNLRQSCNGSDAANYIGMEISQPEVNSFFSYFSNVNSRNMSLYTVVLSLVTPFLLFRYLDHFPRIRTHKMSSKNNDEEVPPKKRIAYRVDVFFSVYPYAKLLALLLATILLIGFGGLALYSVSDGTLTEALWLSWTFVADSGNHADRVGTGPRIVSVAISSGGMLIFATMLGLVSDAISEKVDSLRKGKSEVMESNHILILGWSDKLVILPG